MKTVSRPSRTARYADSPQWPTTSRTSSVRNARLLCVPSICELDYARSDSVEGNGVFHDIPVCFKAFQKSRYVARGSPSRSPSCVARVRPIETASSTVKQRSTARVPLVRASRCGLRSMSYAKAERKSVSTSPGPQRGKRQCCRQRGALSGRVWWRINSGAHAASLGSFHTAPAGLCFRWIRAWRRLTVIYRSA